MTWTCNGSRVAQREVLGQGGEGGVYKTDRPGTVAKVYWEAMRTPDRFAKLKAMITLPPVDPTRSSQNHVSIAWPEGILTDGGKAVGFLMPGIPGASQKHVNVTSAEVRCRVFPTFNWYYMHTAARNVAWVFHNIHAKGYVIGDVKDENLMVTSEALVTLIDTDSMQVPDAVSGMIHPCRVYSPGFTPRERYAAGTQTTRNESEDRFGLAVLIFQMLYGRGPFDGICKTDEEPDVQEKVNRGWYIYAPQSGLVAGKRTLPRDVIHPRLVELFRRCFIDGHYTPTARPTPQDWYDAIPEAIDDLRLCQQGNQHFYSSHYGRCHWCDIRQRNREDYYPTVKGTRKQSESLILPRRFRAALENGDEVVAATLWRASQSALEREFAGERGRVEVCLKVADEVLAFEAACQGDAVDELNAARCFTPHVKASRAAVLRTLQGRRLAELGTAMGGYANAYSQLRECVGQAGMGPDYSMRGEDRLRGLWAKLDQAGLVGPRAHREFAERAMQAKGRCEEWTVFHKALDSRDETRIVLAWDASPGLWRMTEALASKAEVDRCRPIAACIDRFLDMARGPDADEDALKRTWESVRGMDSTVAAARDARELNGQTLIARAGQAKERVAALDRVQACLAKHGTRPPLIAGEAALVKGWQAEDAALAGCQSGRYREYAARAEQASQRVKAHAALVAAIKQQDDREIVRVWPERDEVLGTVALDVQVASALKSAKATTTAADQFKAFYAQSPDDEQGLYGLWDKLTVLHGSAIAQNEALSGNGTTASIVLRVAEAKRRLEVVAEVQTVIVAQDEHQRRTGYFDEVYENRLMGLGAKYAADLRQSRYVASRVGDRVLMAQSRVERTRGILDCYAKRQVSRRRFLETVERLWNGPLLREYGPLRHCASDVDAAAKEMTELRSALDGAGANRVLDLIDACTAAAYSQICTLWDERTMGKLSVLSESIPTIQHAVVDWKLRNVPLLEDPDWRWDSETDSVTIRWMWADPHIELCWVAVADGVFPERPRDVSQPTPLSREVGSIEFSRDGGVPVPFRGTALHVCVWPVVQFMGKKLLGPKPLQFVRARASVITYDAVRRFGGRCGLQIRNLSPHEVLVPPLDVVGSLAEVPSVGDVSMVLGRLLEMRRLEPNEVVGVTCTRPPEWRGERVYVRLHCRHGGGAALTIQDPARTAFF